jgi:outer membrane scaffolding protein for murein synthesis (MipA/OmpV family)
MKGFSVLCLMLSGTAWSQQENRPVFKNNVFLEALGNGGYGSLNFERIIDQKPRLSIGLSAGISTFKTKDFKQNFNPDLIVPIGIRFYYGSNKSKLFFGIGQTMSSTSKLNTEDFNPKRTYHLSANIMVGYRYDFRRIMVQVAYTPMIENYDQYRRWVGLSIGYKF